MGNMTEEGLGFDWFVNNHFLSQSINLYEVSLI